MKEQRKSVGRRSGWVIYRSRCGRDLRSAKEKTGETERRGAIEFHCEESEGGGKGRHTLYGGRGRAIMRRETFYSTTWGLSVKEKEEREVRRARTQKPLTKPIKAEEGGKAEKREERRGVT